jgi:hypothetical protein
MLQLIVVLDRAVLSRLLAIERDLVTDARLIVARIVAAAVPVGRHATNPTELRTEPAFDGGSGEPSTRSARCQDGPVAGAESEHPDLQPEDERTALVQRLDLYRGFAAAALIDLQWEEASARLLPATDLTIAGIVKHLAWAEDRWFQGRLLGVEMPPPWNLPGADDPDHAMRLADGDTIHGIAELYSLACERSRFAVERCDSLNDVAALPSFGIRPVNLRWILVHMIDETARVRGPL